MSATGPARQSLPVVVLSTLIRLYRLVPRAGLRCRFHPSCSGYALEALERHGARRGVLLSARRVGRCHPFNPGGFDPVPPAPVAAGVTADRDEVAEGAAA